MVVVTQHRKKCIGCNYCVELAHDYWRMSKKDGKSTLIGAEDKKGFHTARFDDDTLNDHEKAAKACPVNIIKVRQV